MSHDIIALSHDWLRIVNFVWKGSLSVTPPLSINITQVLWQSLCNLSTGKVPPIHNSLLIHIHFFTQVSQSYRKICCFDNHFNALVDQCFIIDIVSGLVSDFLPVVKFAAYKLIEKLTGPRGDHPQWLRSSGVLLFIFHQMFFLLLTHSPLRRLFSKNISSKLDVHIIF